MPVILWILLLMPSWIYAKSLGVKSCGIYEFQGVPKIQANQMILIINEKTLSELSISIPKKDEPRFAPFLNLTTKGKLEIHQFKDYKTVNAKAFSDLDYAVPNPLKSTDHSYITLKTRRSCL